MAMDMAVDLTVDQMVERAVEKSKNHPSIRRVRENSDRTNSKFEFSHVLPNEVGKQIDALNSKKEIVAKYLPINLRKQRI